MANKTTDPIWTEILTRDPDDRGPLADRIAAVIGISDGSGGEEWALYATLKSSPDRLSVRYNPATNGVAVTVSPIAEHCENDLRRFGVSHRVGVE